MSTNDSISTFSNGEFSIAVEPHPADGFRVQAPGLARALNIADAYTLLRGIPDDEKGSALVRTPGGDQRVGYVTEAGFYRALGMRQTGRIKDETIREKVERFQNWIYRDVLPSIRMTGGYSTQPARIPEGKELLALALVEAQGMLEAKDEQIAALAPKANAWDHIISSEGSWSYKDVAQALCDNHQIVIGEKRLAQLLVEWKYLYRDHKNRPRAYQRYLEQGLFKTRPRFYQDLKTGETRESSAPQVRITGKGMDMIYRRLTAGTVEESA